MIADYSLKHLIRNFTKNIIFLSVIILSVLLFGNYIFTILYNNEKINKFYNTIPVYAYISSKGASNDLDVPFYMVKKMEQTKFVDKSYLQYVAEDCQVYDNTLKNMKYQSGDNGYTVYGINNTEAVPKITYMNGYNAKVFSTNEKVCVVNKSFLEKNQNFFDENFYYKFGDSIFICGYNYSMYEVVGKRQSNQIGIPVKIIGYYTDSNKSTQNIYIPVSCISENIEQFYGKMLQPQILQMKKSYSKASFLLKNTKELQKLKNTLSKTKLWSDTADYNTKLELKKIELSINDTKLNKIVKPLKQNTKTLENVLPIIFIVISCIGILVSYLNSSTIKNEIAIMMILGTKKYIIFIIYMIETLLMTILGTGIGLLIIYLLGKFSIESYIYFVGFTASYIIGCVMSLLLLVNIKPLDVYRNSN